MNWVKIGIYITVAVGVMTIVLLLGCFIAWDAPAHWSYSGRVSAAWIWVGIALIAGLFYKYDENDYNDKSHN